MGKLQKRLVVIGCVAIATSSMSINVIAQPRQQVKQVAFNLETEIKVNGKNIEGITDTSKESAMKLAKKLVADDMEIKSAKIVGSSNGFAQFTNGGKEVGFDQGIVLSTGRVDNIFEEGYEAFNSTNNNMEVEQSGTQYGFTSDDFNDISILEFEVIPKTDTLSFQYVLASEEYPEYATSARYFDEFILLVNGQNYAKVPTTNEEVSIGTVNHLKNNQYYRGISDLYNEDQEVTTGSGITTGSSITTGSAISMDSFVYNGAIKVFSVDVKVKPNEVTTIRLGIGDKGDHIYDSSVFIKANSVIDKPATPGKLNITAKEGNTIFIEREEGSDGYVAADWIAYGVAPLAKGISTFAAPEAPILGTGKVEFNDGETTSNFDVPEGTVGIALTNMIGGVAEGNKTEASLNEIPQVGEIKQPLITGKYQNNKIALNVNQNGNVEGYEYIIERATDQYITQNKKIIKDWSKELTVEDTAIEKGKTYYYQVKAKNLNGFESKWSTVVAVTTTENAGGGGGSSSGSSSSSSDKKEEVKDTKVAFKEKIQAMKSEEKEIFISNLLENMPYTMTKEETEAYLKEAIKTSKLDQKDKEVLLSDLSLIESLELDAYDTLAVEKTELKTFKDVPSKHWAKPYVDELSVAGIVTGYEDDTFKPNQVLNTSETLAFLDRLVKNHEITSIKNSRSVVEKYVTDKENWAFYNVASVASKVEETTLESIKDEDATMTRELLAQIIYELTNGELEAKTAMTSFKDFNTATHKEALTYCVQTGLLNGVPGGEIDPQGKVTRAQLTTILVRLNTALK